MAPASGILERSSWLPPKVGCWQDPPPRGVAQASLSWLRCHRCHLLLPCACACPLVEDLLAVVPVVRVLLAAGEAVLGAPTSPAAAPAPLTPLRLPACTRTNLLHANHLLRLERSIEAVDLEGIQLRIVEDAILQRKRRQQQQQQRQQWSG